MLDGQATDALEASALGHKGDHIDIYINCWGPKDDGKTFGKPGPMAAKALRNGAEKVGLTSIFIQQICKYTNKMTSCLLKDREALMEKSR